MTILREEFHRVVDQLPEAELAPLLDYVRAHAHRADTVTQVWDGPDFLGAFASGRSDVSARIDLRHFRAVKLRHCEGLELLPS